VSGRRPDVRRLGTGDEAIAEEAVARFDGPPEEFDEAPALAVDAAAFLRQPEAHLYVSFADGTGTVAGWVYGHELVHPDGERTMLLYALDVDEAHRRSGHGRALVEAFVDGARAAGCTEVWVLTDADNDAALSTYAAAAGRREPTHSVMFTWFLAPGRHSSNPSGG
jgi:ribosomal protein S18 acetylase RimI-like enzyme